MWGFKPEDKGQRGRWRVGAPRPEGAGPLATRRSRSRPLPRLGEGQEAPGGARRSEGAAGMKVYVRHNDGELMFPSFKDFQAMYRLKFVSPDDLVRRENSERWVRAKDLPELRAMHLYDRPATERKLSTIMWLVTACFAVMILVRLFLQTRAH